jgi:hypothetical protein
MLSNERHEHENRIQTLLNKLDQMKNELEHVQSTSIAERHDLARKLQDVFETALFKGTTKTNSSPPSVQISQTRSQSIDSQIKGKNIS